MEKRVKSRFSHNQINLIPFAESSELYVDAAQRLLLIDADDECQLDATTMVQWNQSVRDFFEDTTVLRTLEEVYLFSNAIGVLKKLLVRSDWRVAIDEHRR